MADLFPNLLDSRDSRTSSDISLFGTYEAVDAGIDLRKEMHNILYGTGGRTQKGHWVILRRYDTTKTTEFYNEVTKESVGGPKHPYSDELILTRCITYSQMQPGEYEATPGIIRAPSRVYYFEYTVNPTEDDVIFEFSWDNHNIMPRLSQLSEPYLQRWNIKLVDPHRCDRGRIEFYKAHVVKDDITYQG